MHYTKFYLRSLLFAVTLFVIPAMAQAETLVTYSYELPAEWTKEGSPYVLVNRFAIPAGKKLTIKEGVVVVVATSSLEQGSTPSMYSEGTLEIRGTELEPVRFHGFEVSLRGQSEYKFDHVHFDNSPVYMDLNSAGPFNNLPGINGTTTLTSSRITGAARGFQVKSGVARIEDTEFVGNTVGVLTKVSAFKTFINIHNSIFENNTTYDVQNDIARPIVATNNWWGKPEGPGSKIKGPVVVEPWKIADPRVKKVECCSNVVFLPGLQASRLYRDDRDLLGSGTTTHRAWEPYTNNDVRSLYLDAEGKSINPTIRTKDVVRSAYGLKGVYNSFFQLMDEFVGAKKIHEWKALAYDWRRPVDEVALSLLPEVERLASTSPTRKVTIIAHSNGGLVAKVMGKELEKQGKSELLDKVILVASPQLGTPQAIAGLLHGDGTSIAGGIVLKSGVARKLGLTMLGGYGLLPSEGYFENILDPVVRIAGKALESFGEYTNFLTGAFDGRSQPAENDTRTPGVLSASLLSKSNAIHRGIDSWQFPTTTQFLSLVGWGTPTVQTVEYSTTSPRIRKSPDGDGTVVVDSATAARSDFSGENLYFNQGLYNKELTTLIDPKYLLRDVSHAYIFEAEPVRDVLSKVVSTSTIASALTSISTYFSKTKPKAEDYPWMKWITVSVHSPVELDIYDSRGRHMGPVALPDAPDSDIQWFENTIGGQYNLIGDEKYYTVPADDVYSVKLKGTGVGSFTFQVQKFVGGDMTETANVVYADLPVTPLLHASTTISSSTLSAPLQLDVDGNGTTDIATSPSLTANPLLHLDAIKTVVLSLNLQKGIEEKFLTRLEKVRSDIEKDKEGKAAKKLQKFMEKNLEEHWGGKKLTHEDTTLLLGLFEQLLTTLESHN